MNLKIRGTVFKGAILLGILIWVLDGVLDYLFFYEGTFFGLTFVNVPPHEIYIRLFWFAGLLTIGFFASRLIDDREKALKELEDLESLLRAVRNVNQMLVRNDDKEELIEGVCNNLIETRGYEHVWVALLDESKELTAVAQEGMGEEFDKLLESLENGELPSCIKEPLNNSRIITLKNPSSTCDCPLSKSYQGQGAISMRLEYGGRIYGLLSASVPPHLVEDEEEQKLIKEVADDIGFAMHELEVEQDLRQSEKKFRSYVENAPVGVYVVNKEGEYVEVNEAASEMTGYSREELLSMGVTDLYPPEAVESARGAFQRLLDQGEMDLELPYTKKDGSEGHMVINAVEISENRYLGFTLDVTDRKEAEQRLKQATLGTLQALNRTIEAKDKYTGEHIDRVQNLSVEIGKKVGLSEERLEQIRYASILHDIGKIGVPDSILGKPGELTEKEWEEMEKHPRVGEKIVNQVNRLERAAKIIGQHQEKYDGTGYPKGLEEEEIMLGARIIAVADAWDAMRTDRPYREALPREKALKELRENAGTQFDPDIVEVTLELLEAEK